MVDQKRVPIQRRSTARYEHPRRLPTVSVPQYKKNGHMHNGKHKHHGHDGGHQFVQGCEPYLLTEDTRCLLERLWLARLSLRGMCRAVGVTLKWLVGFLG